MQLTMKRTICDYRFNCLGLQEMKSLKKNIYLLGILFVTLGFYSCGSEVDAKIVKAIEFVENEDYERAQEICDNVFFTQWDQLTLENKCELSVLYAALYSELSENEEGNLKALRRCYESAMKEDAAAARRYFKSMDEDDSEMTIYESIKFILEMDELGKELENAFEGLDEEYNDFYDF